MQVNILRDSILKILRIATDKGGELYKAENIWNGCYSTEIERKVIKILDYS